MNYVRLIFLFLVSFQCLILQTSAQESSEDRVMKLLKKGVQHQDRKEWAHAVKSYKQVIQSKPQLYKVYNRIGYCFEQLGFYDIAMKYYRKTLSFDPLNRFAKKKIKEAVLEKQRREQESNLEVELTSDEKPRQYGVEDIAHQVKRLWYIRGGKLYTSTRDGSDEYLYSEELLGNVYPDENSKEGFPVEYIQEDGNADIYFLRPNEGTLSRLTASSLEHQSPVFVADRKRVYFLEKDAQGTPSLWSVELKDEAHKTKPERHLEEFTDFRHLFYRRDKKSLFFSAKPVVGGVSRVFRWDLENKPEQLTYGQGEDIRGYLSPNGKLLVTQKRDEKGKVNLHFFDLVKRFNYQLTFFDKTELSGVWSPNSKDFVFGTSKTHDKDQWNGVMGIVDVERKFITTLVENNFQYREFLIDEAGENIYYLTNYDNNFEVYQMNLEKKKEVRLTISDEDEEQLGFWTFSTY